MPEFTTTIEVLKDALHDLSLWSVYNQDVYNEEISEIERLVNKIEERQ